MPERYSLADAFSPKPVAATRDLYDDWAETYERENLAKGYRIPWMGAAMLARHLPAAAGPVLDAGCGTGLVGEALDILGYGPITGCDLSPGMMARAAARGGYASLVQQDMTQPFQWDDGHFAGFICIGCFGPAHAPAESLREMVRVTRPGGIGVFTLLDANLDARGFGPVMRDLDASGAWRVVERTPAFRPYVTGEAEVLTNLFAVKVLGKPG